MIYIPTDKDQSHVIGGLKAAITNPHTSPEAKEHAAERLQELGQEPAHHELGSHQIAGYKATITSSSRCLSYKDGRMLIARSDPNTSEKAKQHAREVLEAEEEVEAQPEHSPAVSAPDQHTKRVLAGYKAALHSMFPVLPSPHHRPIARDSYQISDLLLTDTNVSEEAKERARDILREHGEEV